MPQIPLTPEQIAALTSSGGFVQCQDPATHVHYQLIQYEPPTLDENYIRAKLAEAAQDVEEGRIAKWDVEEIKREVRLRLIEKRDNIVP